MKRIPAEPRDSNDDPVTAWAPMPGWVHLRNGEKVRAIVRLEAWVTRGAVVAAWSPFRAEPEAMRGAKCSDDVKAATRGSLRDELAPESEARCDEFARTVTARWLARAGITSTVPTWPASLRAVPE